MEYHENFTSPESPRNLSEEEIEAVALRAQVLIEYLLTTYAEDVAENSFGPNTHEDILNKSFGDMALTASSRINYDTNPDFPASNIAVARISARITGEDTPTKKYDFGLAGDGKLRHFSGEYPLDEADLVTPEELADLEETLDYFSV